MSTNGSRWSIQPLGAAVTEFRGGASISAEDFTETGFPVLHKGSIQLGGKLDLQRNGKTCVSEEFVVANASAVVDDHFVIATLRNLVRTGETLGFIAPVPIGCRYLLAQGACGLRLDPAKLDSRYLAHLSNAWVFHKEVLRRMVGTTQVHIRNGDFLAVPIPLPPILEQRRIAEILDKADALRAKRRTALAQLDTLTQSIFLDLFGDPATNPKGWPKEPLLRHATVTYGYPFDSQYFGSEGRWKVVRIRDVMRGDSETYYSGSESFEAKHVVVNGDILVGMDGEFNCAKWKGGKALLNQRVCKLAASSNALDVDFLFAVLPSFLKRIEAETPFVTVKHLSAKQINQIHVPLPPKGLQQEFARRLAVINHQAVAADASAATIGALFVSLQHRAFRGEL